MPKVESLKATEIMNIPIIVAISKTSGYIGIFIPQCLHLPLQIIKEITGSWSKGGILEPQLSQMHLEAKTGKELPFVSRIMFVVANPPIWKYIMNKAM